MRKFKLIKEYPGSPKIKHNIILNEQGFDGNVTNWCNPLEYPDYWEEIIEKPEYVKCINVCTASNNYTLNKIYKVSSIDNFVIGNNTNAEDRWLATWNNTKVSKFEPSTKEAYDLQEVSAKFVVGKWYKVSSGESKLFAESRGWYIKYKDYDDIQGVIASEYIHNTLRTEGTFGKINLYTFTALETLDEIQEYLPNNHVDKVTLKPVLFTTHDGVDITDKYTEVWYSTKNGLMHGGKDVPTNCAFNAAPISNINYNWFSTEQLCQAYIDNITKTKEQPKTDLITVQLTKEKYDLLMQLLEE